MRLDDSTFNYFLHFHKFSGFFLILKLKRYNFKRQGGWTSLHVACAFVLALAFRVVRLIIKDNGNNAGFKGHGYRHYTQSKRHILWNTDQKKNHILASSLFFIELAHLFKFTQILPFALVSGPPGGPPGSLVYILPLVPGTHVSLFYAEYSATHPLR